MRILDSIFKTIELIKKKYPAFKIKVASVELERVEYSDVEKLMELLSTYKVAELNVIENRYEIEGVP